MSDDKAPEYKTLADASRLMAESHMKVVDNALGQYIKSAIEVIEHRGEKLEDYALIAVNNPMQLKDDYSVTVTSQWRLLRISKLENTPRYGDD